jgi:hypothetical protein
MHLFNLLYLYAPESKSYFQSLFLRGRPRQVRQHGPRPNPSMPSSPLRLFCVIEDEKIVFPVNAFVQDDVADLKKKVHSERVLDTLQHIGPYMLELWKVCIVDEVAT